MTTFNGASGPLNGAGCGCGGIVAIELAVNVIGDATAAGAARLEVWTSTVGAVLVSRTALGDCTVEVAATESSFGRENVEAAVVVLRDDGLTVLRVPPLEDVGGVVGASSSPADGLLVAAAGSPSTVVCASGVGAFSEDVAFDSVDEVDSTGFVLSVVEVDEESAAPVEADDVVLESVGAANATAGVVATAQPTPSATANAPTRPT
ncbi:hypothetical protein GGC64_002606 [Mycobacterium sp. OAS707]|uniref:hypothetical protein n=1 Tax=Mycobacterium sp. OAS707 TaxID=2663822 RepID=UPI00178B559A|nr:hypothetical protein [Mycobacterium sp. OAS707]MBE1548582.1 hypothetical protein [Mycobacterium sp. OAS707]